jgi:hypothetical protein
LISDHNYPAAGCVVTSGPDYRAKIDPLLITSSSNYATMSRASWKAGVWALLLSHYLITSLSCLSESPAIQWSTCQVMDEKATHCRLSEALRRTIPLLLQFLQLVIVSSPILFLWHVEAEAESGARFQVRVRDLRVRWHVYHMVTVAPVMCTRPKQPSKSHRIDCKRFP